ncbi:hypothetical protein QIS74_05687 [Colletotrichum tabaci]|uniref:Uncharacterized protein n=1 Tax=Colletotrichum tabaci TaxID=1209068 RepID=A0AAV9TJ21_9PEZI
MHSLPASAWVPREGSLDSGTVNPSDQPDASHGPLVVIPRAAVAAPPPHLSPLLASWDWEAIKIHQQDVDLVPNQGLTLGLFRMRWCDFAIPNRDSDAWGSAVTDR